MFIIRKIIEIRLLWIIIQSLITLKVNRISRTLGNRRFPVCRKFTIFEHAKNL